MAGALIREQVLWRWRIFICTYAGYAAYYLARKAYSICKSSLNKQFDWDSGQRAHFRMAYTCSQRRE